MKVDIKEKGRSGFFYPLGEFREVEDSTHKIAAGVKLHECPPGEKYYRSVTEVPKRRLAGRTFDKKNILIVMSKG